MAVAFYRVLLSVKPTKGGEAELIVPQKLAEANYQFSIVKEGCEEGILRVNENESVLKELSSEEMIEKLTKNKFEELKASYPSPKLKQKYRERNQSFGESGSEGGNEPYETDELGSRIVDTYQTVRSGFYLIDVLVASEVESTQ